MKILLWLTAAFVGAQLILSGVLEVTAFVVCAIIAYGKGFSDGMAQRRTKPLDSRHPYD